MAKVKIYFSEEEPYFEGVYEFVEGGTSDEGKLGFHIDAHSEKNRQPATFEIEFDNLEEYETFIKVLRRQIKSKEK